MIIIEKLEKIPQYYGKIALTIGNFEGYHRGHKAIVRTLKAEADRRKLSTCIITFKNHPLKLLKGIEPQRLWSKCDKVITFYREGIDLLIYLDFSLEFAHQEPEDFLNLIKKSINPSLICLGETFRFGRENKGDINLVKSYSKINGWNFLPIKDLEIYGTKISSTIIRNKIREGDFNSVTAMLGRKYSIYLKPEHDWYKKNVMKLFVDNMAVPDNGIYKGELIDLKRKEYYDTIAKFKGDLIVVLSDNILKMDSLYSFNFKDGK